MLLLMVVAALCLTGCLHAAASPAPATGLAAAILFIHDKLKKDKKLWFDIGDADPKDWDKLTPRARELKMLADGHRGFFIVQRTTILGTANPAWVSAGEPYTSLTNRVLEDLAEADAFLTQQFTGGKSLSNPAPDGVSAAGPTAAFQCKANKHIDINSVARVYDNAEPVLDRASDQQRFRVNSAYAIILRAPAIHDALWDNTKPATQRLRTAQMTELLDRRLRTIERMRFQVNSLRQTDPRSLTRTGNDRGPWIDHVRVRMFEYPTFRASAKSLMALEDTGEPDPRLWDIEPDEIRWVWARPTNQHSDRTIPTRLDDEPTDDPDGTDAESSVWIPINASDAYLRRFSNLGKLSAAMEKLMAPDLDFWKRSWLYCDHVCCAVQIDGLRFALARQSTKADGSFDDDDFDAIPGDSDLEPGKKDTYLETPLGEIPDDPSNPKTKDNNWLTSDGEGADATWFENMFLGTDKLQVGDHTIFWNHIIYEALWSGAFRLENALVSEIQSDPSADQAGILAPKLKMEGHGMTELDVGGFQSSMAGRITSGFKRLRADAMKGVSFGIGEGFGFTNWRGYRVFPWKPYPDITWDATKIAGPWWVFIPRVTIVENKARWPNVAAMLDSVGLSISADDPSPGAGGDYNQRPPVIQARKLGSSGLRASYTIGDGVLFPLYLPLTSQGSQLDWKEYFDARKNSSFPVRLVEYKMPAKNIPGFFVGGKLDRSAQVLRPKVRVP